MVNDNHRWWKISHNLRLEDTVMGITFYTIFYVYSMYNITIYYICLRWLYLSLCLSENRVPQHRKSVLSLSSFQSPFWPLKSPRNPRRNLSPTSCKVAVNPSNYYVYAIDIVICILYIIYVNGSHSHIYIYIIYIVHLYIFIYIYCTYIYTIR